MSVLSTKLRRGDHGRSRKRRYELNRVGVVPKYLVRRPPDQGETVHELRAGQYFAQLAQESGAGIELGALLAA